MTNGPVTGTNYYSVTGGFWALPIAVQTVGAPLLTIVPAAPGVNLLAPARFWR